MSERKRVLITGAGGHIGSSLSQSLKDHYELRLHFHHPPEVEPAADYVIADVANFQELVPAMTNIDAIVHLAGSPHVTSPWDAVHQTNIVGTYNVFETARLAGVRKIVFASTNHVMGMYDRDRDWPVYADQPVRPDSLYGVSKAFGETLGRFYVDQYGMSIIALRIGWFLEEPHDEIGRWMWLSPRDCAQIVWRAIEADIGYGVFYATSANSGRRWDITDAINMLGYRPQDDAETFFLSEEGNT